jgi:KRAB domain-containing zinc finger protein
MIQSTVVSLTIVMCYAELEPKSMEKRKTKGTIHICLFCGQSFKFLKLLKTHEKQHIDRNGNIEPPETGVIREKDKNHGTKILHKCNYCSKTFRYIYRLKDHELQHVDNCAATAADAAQSSVASAQMDSSTVVEESPKVKDGYICSHCKKCFKKSKQLISHIRVHTGERPYRCSYPDCNKSFKQSCYLVYHERLHSGETPSICPDCGRQFRHPGLLSAHALTHSGVKRYHCSDCGASFITAGKLKRHSLVHSGVKAYQCSQCTMSFKFCWALNRHIKAMHEGQKPYSCHLCGRQFAFAENMRKHLRTHSGERPYVCPVCGARFLQQGFLKAHLASCESKHVAAESRTEVVRAPVLPLVENRAAELKPVIVLGLKVVDL